MSTTESTTMTPREALSRALAAAHAAQRTLDGEERIANKAEAEDGFTGAHHARGRAAEGRAAIEALEELAEVLGEPDPHEATLPRYLARIRDDQEVRQAIAGLHERPSDLQDAEELITRYLGVAR